MHNNHNPSGRQIDWFQKQVNIQTLLEKLAPGVPSYNRKRAHDPIAYHRYFYPCCNSYEFYVMEYMIVDNHFIRFWGYEIDREAVKHTNTLSSWYRTIGMMTLIETGMKRDTSFTPEPALEIPKIGKEWISQTHDSKRDSLAASYIRKYYKSYALEDESLMKDLTDYYDYKGEQLDQQFLRELHKN